MNTGKPQKTLNEASKIRLTYKLNQVCNLLDELYDTNAGGCCYIAYCVAKLLLNDGFNNVKLLVFTDDDVEGCWPTFQDIPESQPHYAIEVEDQRINCDGYEEQDYYELEYPITNASSILKHYKRCNWNTDYSKRKNSYVSRVLKSFHDDFIKDLCKR